MTYFKSTFLATFEERPKRSPCGNRVTRWEIVKILQIREDDDLVQGGRRGSGEKRLDYVYKFEGRVHRICR